MNDDILWEVSNIYRTNISRRRIHKKNKKSKVSLEQQANAICKNLLSERYIHNAFGKFDSGYAYYDSDESQLLGFCLWKLSKAPTSSTLHILVLCSSDPQYSLGKTMIQDIEYYCFENKIESITVSPASQSLVGYYSKLGFSTDKNDTSLMIKQLSLPHIKRRRNNKTRKVPIEKREYPIIASMMPMNLNTWKNNLV